MEFLFWVIAGFLSGLGLNLWLKSIDYALEKERFADNKETTLREVILEGLIDVLHHMPLWWIIAALVLTYPLPTWWMKPFFLAFAFGNIFSDIPEFVKRMIETIRIKIRYKNIRKALIRAKDIAEKLAKTGIPVVSEVANTIATLLEGATNGNLEEIQQEIEKIKQELEKTLNIGQPQQQ